MRPTIDSGVEIPTSASDWLEGRLSGELDLPMLPEAAARIITLCDDEKSDARAIESALERDPALTAAVLKAANSALYAAKEPIVSVHHAVSRLGMATVRNLALSASLQSRMFEIPGHASAVRDVWEHCAVTGLYAREIARKLRHNVEAAFLCGLVHDVGRPIVLRTVLQLPRDRGTLTEDQVEAAVDYHHARTGARLVAAWKLADWAVAAVEHHHDPDRADPHEDEARITRLADMCAHWALGPRSGTDEFPHVDPVIASLNMYPDDIDDLLAMRAMILQAAEALR